MFSYNKQENANVERKRLHLAGNVSCTISKRSCTKNSAESAGVWRIYICEAKYKMHKVAGLQVI